MEGLLRYRPQNGEDSMSLPSKEEIEKDADVAATYFVRLIQKGVGPQEAASMSAMYLAQIKREVFPGDDWKGT
jgi:hypothetical protein